MNANEPAAPGQTSPRRVIRLGGLVIAAGSVAAACTIAAFFGDAWWLLDLTSHFRVQYAALLFGGALIAIVRREFRTAAIFTAFMLVNAVVVAETMWNRSEGSSARGPTLRLVYANVNTANANHDVVRRFLEESKADVIVLSEVNERWIQALAGLTNDYRHAHIHAREDNFGIALLSKHELIEPESVDLSDAEVPTIRTAIQVDDRRVLVVATHPVPPGSAEGTRLRNAQLAALSAMLAARDTPALLIGDLNTTPWSGAFKRLLRRSGMKNSTVGFSLCATWPAGLFPLRIPIDHCLVSSELHVVAKQTGPNIGSDHYPLIVDLRLP